MAVWGIAARLEQGLPVVTGVELSGDPASPVGRLVLLHRCEPGDMAKALMLLAADLEHELSKGAPEVVVIRSMDWFRSPHENVVKPRMQAEGVLLAVARRAVQIVESHSGRELGDICGIAKASLEADATRLLPNLDRDAVVAGLAALVIAGRE